MGKNYVFRGSHFLIFSIHSLIEFGFITTIYSFRNISVVIFIIIFNIFINFKIIFLTSSCKARIRILIIHIDFTLYSPNILNNSASVKNPCAAPFSPILYDANIIAFSIE